MAAMSALQCSRQRNLHRSFGAGFVGEKRRSLEEIAELPEEILEMIIAKMPFPSLFKARVLSKRWHVKFSSPSQQLPVLCQDASSISFQRQVSLNSARWETYAPVVVNWSRSLLISYHRTASKWFAPLPPDTWQPRGDNWRTEVGQAPAVCLAGALVLLITRRLNTYIVGNIINGTYRYLTEPPHLGSRKYRGIPGARGVIAVGCHSYKVLSVYFVVDSEESSESYLNALCIHLYDSSSHTWTSTLSKCSDSRALHGMRRLCPHHACKDGKVYFLILTRESYILGPKLVSYDLLKQTWEIVAQGFAKGWHLPSFSSGGVYLCGDKVIVIISSKSVTSGQRGEDGKTSMWLVGAKSIQVFQLDIQSLELILISHGPSRNVLLRLDDFSTRQPFSFSADANFVSFGWDCLSSMIKFDLNRREWLTCKLASPKIGFKGDQLSWVQGAFEPGLNPFVSI